MGVGGGSPVNKEVVVVGGESNVLVAIGGDGGGAETGASPGALSLEVPPVTVVGSGVPSSGLAILE